MRKTTSDQSQVRSKRAVIIICTIVLGLSAVVLCWYLIRLQVSKPKLPVYDELLSPKVSEYLSVNAKGIFGSESYDASGNPLIGQPENYCEALIYGYDEQYIYAHATCQEYGWFYHYNTVPDKDNTIQITRSVIRGRGWSSHVRLAYAGADFKITSYDEPRGGNAYQDDLEQMFAPMGKIDFSTDPAVAERLLEEFRSQHKNDPYPSKIEEIYLLKNPQIIIGGEVEE